MTWIIPVDAIPQNVMKIKVGPYTMEEELNKIQKIKGLDCPDLIGKSVV